MRCVVEFAGRARSLGGLKGLLPPSAVYRFELGVVEEGGAWRVREAAWEPVLQDPAEDETNRLAVVNDQYLCSLIRLH